MGKLKAWARGHGMLDDGNEQQYQADVMAELEKINSMKDDRWWDDQDAIQTAREVAGQCPKCGGEMETNHTEYMNIETFVRVCMECDYQGVPE